MPTHPEVFERNSHASRLELVNASPTGYNAEAYIGVVSLGPIAENSGNHTPDAEQIVHSETRAARTADSAPQIWAKIGWRTGLIAPELALSLLAIHTFRHKGVHTA